MTDQDQLISARQRLKDRIDAAYKLQLKIENLKSAIKELQEQLDEQEFSIQQVLEATNDSRAEGSQCSVYIKEESSVKIPRTDEDKAALWKYLKKVKAYEQLRTINSRSLNSWYRAQQSLAEANGELDFRVPGLERPTTYRQLVMRKK